MNIVEINSTNYSSTGNIMLNIAKEARKNDFKVFTCCKKSIKSLSFDYDNQIYIGYRIERIISEKIAELTGYSGCFNWFGSLKFIKKLKQIKPDIIHIHIFHETFINHRMLFNYINKNNIPIIWTFHDCWTFTGKCPYFDDVDCSKWKNGCNSCQQLKRYPTSFFDNTKKMWKIKKELFTSVQDLTVVTPSLWLADLVKQSFFDKYDIKVINNGINLDIFKPTSSNFKDKYNLSDKYVVLGVGYIWNERKGLKTFIELAKRLPEKYKIVLVGTNDQIDKTLPNNIISIHRTYNQEELVKIYSVADVFVNPTLEDNYPTVNIEALACGTPVLTYNTGGSAEIIDYKSGSYVNKGDINSFEKELIRICEDKPYSREDCLRRAKEFDMNIKFKEYVSLYKEVLNK